jgi:hypothetical protein
LEGTLAYLWGNTGIMAENLSTLPASLSTDAIAARTCHARAILGRWKTRIPRAASLQNPKKELSWSFLLRLIGADLRAPLKRDGWNGLTEKSSSGSGH